MSRLSRSGLIVVLAFGAQGCATAMQRRPPSYADSLGAIIGLEGINDHYWRFVQVSQPELAARAGVVVTRLPDPTLDQSKRDAQFARAALAALDQVQVDALREDSYVTWLSLRWEMEAMSGWTAYHWTRLTDLAPGRSVFDRTRELLQAQLIKDPGAAQRFLGLINEIPRLVRDVRLEFEERARRDIRPSVESMNRAIAHVRGFIAADRASPLGLPADFNASPDTAWQMQLTRDVADAIAERVNPSLEQLAAFLDSERSRAPETIGLSRMPGGASYYAALLRYRTTLEVTPEDAHTIGLREVARLAARATAARNDAGLPVNRDSLRAALAGDTSLAVGDGSIQERAARVYEGIEKDLDSLFQPRPRTPLSIGVQMELTMSSPRAVYHAPTAVRPAALYLLNIMKQSTASALVLPSLVVRDLMPGLHLQRATQFENRELPAFRRLANHDGFARGWQSYALHVADSLGRVLTPPQRFGVRLSELAAACGLVVDTGINALGWSRADALAFLRAWLPDDDADLERDFILEAIDAPGTLSAGTLGARELRGLRQWAMRELGDRFSLTAFHRELLRVGSVPLPVLGSHLERWIWEQNHPTPPLTARR